MKGKPIWLIPIVVDSAAPLYQASVGFTPGIFGIRKPAK